MSLKPIEPRHFSTDDVDPGTGTRITNQARSMNHYASQRRRDDGSLPPDVTGGMRAYSHTKPARDPKKTIIAIVGAIVAVVLVIAMVIFGVSSCSQQVSEQQEEGAVTITIPSGYGAGDIAQLLRDNGVIGNTTEFVQAVTQQGAESSLKPGAYTFERGTSSPDVVEALVAGPAVSGTTLVIPEGLTVSQTAARVADTFESISYDEFMAQAKASNYVGEFTFLAGVYNDSLEGYLFPKTYTFADGVTADTIIRTMLHQFQVETAQIDWSAAAQGNVALTPYEVVIMASLVERETGVAQERPIVASVMYNRLNVGMQLQIDAAIAYALDKHDLLTYEDLQVDSPFNLYTNYGLCPAPICSPSLEAIQAVVAADTTDYYFYVASANLDGSHVFCPTYEEFEAARAAYNEAMGIVG